MISALEAKRKAEEIIDEKFNDLVNELVTELNEFVDNFFTGYLDKKIKSEVYLENFKCIITNKFVLRSTHCYDNTLYGLFDEVKDIFKEDLFSLKCIEASGLDDSTEIYLKFNYDKFEQIMSENGYTISKDERERRDEDKIIIRWT